jgi:hypothetical protein
MKYHYFVCSVYKVFHVQKFTLSLHVQNGQAFEGECIHKRTSLLSFKLSTTKKVYLPDKQAVQTLQPIQITKIKRQETVAQDRKVMFPPPHLLPIVGGQSVDNQLPSLDVSSSVQEAPSQFTSQ